MPCRVICLDGTKQVGDHVKKILDEIWI